MAFNLRCRDSRMKYRFNSGISTPVIRSDDIPTLYPTECSICPRPRGLSREWRRTIDDDYDKQSRCPRGFVLYRPSSRSSWPSSLLASPLLFSNYIIPTREPHTHSHTPYKSEKKNTSWEKVACACESSSNPIYCDAPETFSGITLGHDLSGIRLRIGCHSIPSDRCTSSYVYIRYCAPIP